MGRSHDFRKHIERVIDTVGAQQAHQQNFIFIFDDSPTGKAALQKFLREGPPNFRDALGPRLPEFLRQGPRYISFCGNLAYSGGTSFAGFDERDLLDGMIPAMVERVLQRGGLSAVSVAVDPTRAQAIEHRFAELQPTLGRDGLVDVPVKLTELLADDEQQLMEPMAGGIVLPYAHAVLSKTSAQKIQAALSEAAGEWLALGETQLAAAVQRPHAERLPDSSLFIYAPRPDKRSVSITVQGDQWSSTAIQLGELRGWPNCVPPSVVAREALHGGTYMDNVKIQYGAIPGLIELAQATLRSWKAENPSGLDVIVASDGMPFVHEAMADGSLRFTAVSPLGGLSTIDIPPGYWEPV